MSVAPGRWKRTATKLGLVPVLQVSIFKVFPSPENDQIYRPIDPKDPAIKELAESIRRNGLLEAIVITADGYIISGHRRYAAAKLVGLSKIPARRLKVSRTKNRHAFVKLLREHNRQRDKTHDEKLREDLIDITPDEAHAQLYAYRREQAAVGVEAMVIHGEKRRDRISEAKQPFLSAIVAIVMAMKKFWPLSVRQIHYQLLNDPPLRHAGKPGSVYRNDLSSYKSLCELATRARLTFEINPDAIADETRPVRVWNVHADPRTFVKRELDALMRGYCRDLMQSQPNHIEIVGEKNTVLPILRPIAQEYCISLTIGRGYCSLSPRQAMANRYFKSGKEKLVLLVISDHDPDGEEIGQSFARSMRDEFGIDNIHPVRVALTADQVAERKLIPNMVAKEKSANCKKFVQMYGQHVYELESLDPADLQQILRTTIEAVIDKAAYSAEIEAERADAHHLAALRRRLLEAAKGVEEVDG